MEMLKWYVIMNSLRTDRHKASSIYKNRAKSFIHSNVSQQAYEESRVRFSCPYYSSSQAMPMRKVPFYAGIISRRTRPTSSMELRYNVRKGFWLWIIFRCNQGLSSVWICGECRVGKGISAQASHRTVREALTSYGSSCFKNSRYYSSIMLNLIIPILYWLSLLAVTNKLNPSLHLHYRNFNITTI